MKPGHRMLEAAMVKPLRTVRVVGEGVKALQRGSLMVYRKWVKGRLEPAELAVIESESGDILGCGIYDPIGPVALRVVELGSCTFSSLEEALHDRLLHAYRLRRRLGYTEPHRGFRLVHSDGDLLPGLVVDVYNRLVVYQSSSAVWDAATNTIVEALKEILDSDVTVYEKSTQRARRDIGLPPREGVRWKGRAGLRAVIEEGGAQFIVDPRIGQKTGFFLDQALNRIDAERLVDPGWTVLDLFSYTGGFGIHALLAGAREAVFVEVDEKAVKILYENLELNRVKDKAKVIVDNVWNYLRTPREGFNAVFVDPPAFIPSEKDFEKGVTAYRHLYTRAVRLLKAPGMLFLSSCSTFLSEGDFRKVVAEALSGRDYHLVGDVRRTPPDHTGRLNDPYLNYLKAVYLEVYG